MLPQQKLIITSIISALFISVVIAIYLYKKGDKRNYLIILLLLSLMPLVSILRPGSYESGDLSINVYKTMALAKSLQEGVFPANWAGILNATYGYPLFNFTYPFPYYTSWIFHLVGFTFLDSLKLFIAACFVFSGIGMYYFLKQYLKPLYSFVGSIFYLFAPYHLVDMHFRVDIGEMAAIAFVPFIFLWTTKLLKEYRPHLVVFLAISLCGLLLSHQAVSLTILPFLGAYVIVFSVTTKKKLTDLFPLLWAGLIGFGLCAFYVIPVLFELQFTQQAFTPVVTFQNFSEFIYAPWRYGFLFQGHTGELSFIIGYTHLIMLIFSLYLLWKSKIRSPYKLLLIYSLISFSILFIFMQSFTQPLWHIAPLFKNFQFSYRLMSGVIFFVAIIGAITAQYLPKKIVYIFVFITIFSTILNWGNRRNLPEITDAYLLKNLSFSTFQGEGLTPAAPKWVDPKNPWFQYPPKQHLEVLSGKGVVKNVSWKTNIHMYVLQTTTPVILRENTVYFPGWHVFVNHQPTSIHISEDKGKKGIITFSAPKGTSEVKVIYAPTLDRKVGIGISLVSVMFCFFLILSGYKKYSLASILLF